MTASVEAWLAHEGESLLDHLRDVGALARRFAPEPLGAMAELAGLVHDLGKATVFFQDRLRGQERGGAEANHAYLGALYGAWVAEQRGQDALTLFLAVSRHHGPLRSPRDVLPHPSDIDPPDFRDVDRPGLRQTLRALPVQLAAVRESWPHLCVALGLPDPLPFLDGEVWHTFRRLADEASELSYLEYYDALDQAARRRYWQTNIVFSALIDADKKLAAGYHEPPRRALPGDLVDRFQATLPDQGPLARFRG